MEFCLLGPLEVEDGGRLLRFRGKKERALLAFLLLHAGEVVSRERLIELLWRGRQPPAGAMHSLETYVSRLRKTIGSDGTGIEFHPAAYRLRIRPEQIDLRRFEALVEEGWQTLAAGEPENAADRFTAALALWRGSPIPELSGDPDAEIETSRLEELRLSALEGQIDAQLALGRNDELIGRLQKLVAAHPLREGLQRRLMLVLYRSGRQAEALEVYQQTRRRLVDQLGIEPGEQLKELQQAILRHDEALADRPNDIADVSPTPAPGAARSHRFAPRTPETSPMQSERLRRRLWASLRPRRRASRAIEAIGWDVYTSARIAPDELRPEIAALGGAIAIAARAADDADRLLAQTDHAQLARRLREYREEPVSERTVIAAAPIAQELAALEALQAQRQRFESERERLAVRLSALIDGVFQTRWGQTAPSLLSIEVRELLEVFHTLTADLQAASARYTDSR